MRDGTRLARIIPLLSGSLVTLIIVLLIHRDYPFVGHDYRYFITRLIDTNLHIQLNGLSIQWYTPSFGGGLPAFPNPQNLEYSFVQLVSYAIGPWNAILATTATISLTGYSFFYKLLKEKIGLDWRASTLGAIFFLGNGFYIEHLIVGQLGYQLFPLSSVILYLLLDQKNGVLVNATAIALLIAAMVHQAGFYLLVIFFFSFVISLISLYLLRPQILDIRRILAIAWIAIPIAGLVAGSKMYAVFSLMRHFPRLIVDVYNTDLLQGLVGVIAQFFGVMSIAPIMILLVQNTDFLSGALSNITGAEYGIWETDISLSPVLLVFLLLQFARSLRSIRAAERRKWNATRKLACALLFLSIWVVLELTLARGPIFSIMKNLPILGSLHVNVRFASVFIMPLVITGAFVLDRFFQQQQDLRYFVLFCALSIAALSSYFFLSSDIHSRAFSVPATPRIENGDLLRISEILDIQDWEVFTERASSYRTYEPLFGYELEAFTPETHPGNIFEENNGYFNMTNPAGLVYPETNQTYPFERIKVSERDKLEDFRQRRQPAWRIPATQAFLNYLSMGAMVLCTVGLLAGPFVRTRRIK